MALLWLGLPRQTAITLRGLRVFVNFARSCQCELVMMMGQVDGLQMPGWRMVLPGRIQMAQTSSITVGPAARAPLWLTRPLPMLSHLGGAARGRLCCFPQEMIITPALAGPPPKVM